MPAPETPLDDFLIDWEHHDELVPGTENPTFDTPWDNDEGPGQMRRGLVIEGLKRNSYQLYDSRGEQRAALDLDNCPTTAAGAKFRRAIIRALRDLLDEIDPLDPPARGAG